jgi:hypothetical protein
VLGADDHRLELDADNHGRQYDDRRYAGAAAYGFDNYSVRMVVLLAGNLAERRIWANAVWGPSVAEFFLDEVIRNATPIRELPGGTFIALSDFYEAAIVAHNLHENQEEARAELRRATHVAIAILDANWSRVEAVALALGTRAIGKDGYARLQGGELEALLTVEHKEPKPT